MSVEFFYYGGSCTIFRTEPAFAALSRISLTLGQKAALAAPLAVSISSNLVTERMFKQPVYRFSSQGGSGTLGTEQTFA